MKRVRPSVGWQKISANLLLQKELFEFYGAFLHVSRLNPTQDPAQIYPFARKMIARHSHVVRRFGTKWLDVFMWEELQEEVKSGAKRDNAQRQTRTLPEHAHKHYKSATVHTIKAKLPLKLFILPLAIAGAFASFWIAYNYFKPSAVAARLGSPMAGVDAPLGAPAPTEGHADAPAGGRPRDVAAYIKDFQPRIAAAPWTAPAWDKRGVVSDPELFCMASEPGEDVNGKWRDASCSCITEQGTRYAIDNAECRRLATEGPVYNPFKRPQQRSEREQRRAEVREEEEQRPQLRETATPYGAAPPPAARFALDPVRSSP